MKQLMNNMNNGLFKLIHNCQIDKPDQHWTVGTELNCLTMIKSTNESNKRSDRIKIICEFNGLMRKFTT